jgi:hypothetical protein
MKDAFLQVAAVAESGAHLLPWWAWAIIGLVVLGLLIFWIRGWRIDTSSYN